MKKIQKLKLSHLSKEEMEKREMNHLKGGCYCNCFYAGEQGENCGSSGDSYYGGSSNIDNSQANWDSLG